MKLRLSGLRKPPVRCVRRAILDFMQYPCAPLPRDCIAVVRIDPVEYRRPAPLLRLPSDRGPWDVLKRPDGPRRGLNDSDEPASAVGLGATSRICSPGLFPCRESYLFFFWALDGSYHERLLHSQSERSELPSSPVPDGRPLPPPANSTSRPAAVLRSPNPRALKLPSAASRLRSLRQSAHVRDQVGAEGRLRLDQLSLRRRPLKESADNHQTSAATPRGVYDLCERATRHFRLI